MAAFPERVIQFGEGNFLRAFVDWMLQKANQAEVFAGSAIVVQPIPTGLAAALNAQDSRYTVVLRGQQAGKPLVECDIVESISRCLDSYSQWDKVLQCAADPQVDIMVSNTTEAGIAYDADDSMDFGPPLSFPGKVCAYLYRRYQAFAGDSQSGMLILPCELIENNGTELLNIVLRLADEWGLPDAYSQWVADANTFANTLVDRIVTGYPGEKEAAQFWERTGFRDPLLTTGELFHLWVIEAPAAAAERLPLHKAGLEVHWVDDLTPYRTRKVRILNGAHTSLFSVVHLLGHTTVRETVEEPLTKGFLDGLLFKEVVPSMGQETQELDVFAGQVLERFRNPYIEHRWLDISLNAAAKLRARVLPSLTVHAEAGRLPQRLVFSLAAFIRFYRGTRWEGDVLVGEGPAGEYPISDDPSVLNLFYSAWQDCGSDYQGVVEAILADVSLWGLDLTQYPGLVKLTAEFLECMDRSGMETALQRIEG